MSFTHEKEIKYPGLYLMAPSQRTYSYKAVTQSALLTVIISVFSKGTLKNVYLNFNLYIFTCYEVFKLVLKS